MPETNDDSTRQRIRDLVHAYPGLHLRELARQMGTSVALVEYHVPALLDAGDIERVVDAGVHRLYPAALPDQATLAVLRDKHRLHIALKLLEHGPMRHVDLAANTGLGKSTLSFHVTRLRRAGVVEKADGVFALVDADGTRALLERHRPTPDLVDRFADLWGDLYGTGN